MQLLEFMRPFTGDLAANPSSQEASLAYQALTAYIYSRHAKDESAVTRSVSPGFGDLNAYLYLDVDETLIALQVHTPIDTPASWLYTDIRVPEGKHLYVADPHDSVVRRIDRPDEVEHLVDNALRESEEIAGPIGALLTLANVMEAGKSDEEQGLNNQPVDAKEVASLIAFCDRGLPLGTVH